MASLSIHVLVSPARARLWHRRLVEQLRALGHRVSVDVVRGAPSPPLAMTLILALERLVYSRVPNAPADLWPTESLEKETASAEMPELVLDFTGRDGAGEKVRCLRPMFETVSVEEAAVSQLLQGVIPRVGVVDSAAPSRPYLVEPAVENRLVLSRALDNLGARLLTLFLQAVARVAAGREMSGAALVELQSVRAWRAGSLSALIARARLALTSLSTQAPHWFVGWREADADRLSETLRLPESGWHSLPDDGQRYYADPFVVRHGGRRWMFVEEFPFATQKGILSVSEISPLGAVGTPRPFLELAHHLSYPFIFQHDGAYWLIPESSQAKRVEIYRAIEFPMRWEFVAVLVDGVEVSDATVVEHGGRLWMVGTVSGGGASTWDALHLWSADRLLGQWRHIGDGPALVDARSARPAGAFFRRGMELWRPAQDCGPGYGAALALARVDRLSEEGFAQTVMATIAPGGSWPGKGLHTLNWAAGIEVIDGAR